MSTDKESGPRYQLDQGELTGSIGRSEIESINISPQEALKRLQEGKEGPEIWLGSEKWTAGEYGSIPDPKGNLEDFKIDLLKHCRGLRNYWIRILEDPTGTEEPFYQLVIKTGLENVYLTETYYPYPEYGLSQLSVRQGEPKILPTVPKKIDIPANMMRGILNRELRQTTISNERFQKEFIDSVKELKYILLDVDDCLLSTSREDSAQNMENLERFAELTHMLRDEGIKVIFNTGRGIANVEQVIQVIEGYGGVIEGAICENGSAYYDREKAKRREKAYETDPELSPETMAVRNAISRFLKEALVQDNPETGKQIFGSFESGKLIGISLNPASDGVHRAKKEIPIEEVIKRAEAEGTKGLKPENIKDIDYFKVWIVKLLNENKEKIAEYASEEAKKEGLSVDADKAGKILEAISGKIKNSSTAVDINPGRFDEATGKFVGIDKKRGTYVFCDRQGIQWLGRKKGEKIPGIIGVGDSGGDLPTLTEVKTAIPWNATFDLRDNPDVDIIYFSADAMEQGVNDILLAIYRARTQVKLERISKK